MYHVFIQIFKYLHTLREFCDKINYCIKRVKENFKLKKKVKKFFKHHRFMFTLPIILIIVFLISFFSFLKLYPYINNSTQKSESNITAKNTDKHKTDTPVQPEEPKKVTKASVLLSSVGDCTLGTDDKFEYSTSLPAVLKKHNSDLSYFFKNVSDIFKNDDITTANLETTFTNATTKNPKQFNFKGPKEYAKALTLGHIEGVNLSNNHIHDYLDKGISDTIQALNEAGVNYFGEGSKWIKEVNGVKFGFLGYMCSTDKSFLNKLKNDIEDLKSQGCIVVINFHGGVEGSYTPVESQVYLYHFAIDNGADLIIGHHPHVIEGIELYKNKIICYSLGNFCFGGNSNPPDKDTFIFQCRFNFENEKLVSYDVRVIPCSISSVITRNDYCPTPMNGDRKTNFLKKLNKLSGKAGFQISDNFYNIIVNN